MFQLAIALIFLAKANITMYGSGIIYIKPIFIFSYDGFSPRKIPNCISKKACLFVLLNNALIIQEILSNCQYTGSSKRYNAKSMMTKTHLWYLEHLLPSFHRLSDLSDFRAQSESLGDWKPSNRNHKHYCS